LSEDSKALKINEKFAALWTCKTRYCIITGGRGSSKSFSVGVFTGLRTFAPLHRILFTRYTLTSAHVSIIPEFNEKIDLLGGQEYFTTYKKEVINTVTGSEILFRGIKAASGDQTANLKSLQGITTLILEEAEELTDEDTFDKIDLSIRSVQHDNLIILILNPTSKEHWIYKRFFEGKWTPGKCGVRGDVTYIHTTFLDNVANLSKSFVKTLLALKKTNSKKFQHVVMGGWLDKAEGVIFSNWTRGTWNDQFAPVHGLDFGYSVDPTALVTVAINENRKKLWVRLEFYEPHMKTPHIVAGCKAAVKYNRLIVADSAEDRMIDEMKDAGLNIIGAKKGPDSVNAGIKLMQDYEIIVCDSPKLEVELNNYVWDKKGKTPVDAYNHAIDAIRYVVLRYHGLIEDVKQKAYGGKNKPKTLRDKLKNML
jgi:phage terminase large subunit